MLPIFGSENQIDELGQDKSIDLDRAPGLESLIQGAGVHAVALPKACTEACTGRSRLRPVNEEPDVGVEEEAVACGKAVLGDGCV